MPIYEFKCAKCEAKFEELLGSSSNSAKCPKCGSGDVKKLFSGFGVKSDGSFTSNTSGCSSCAKSSCSSCKPSP